MPVISLPLARLFDDASQFPPGNLKLKAAVDAHDQWRRDRHSDLVGRFLTPVVRLLDLARGEPDRVRGWDVGLVISGGDGLNSAEVAAGAARVASSLGLSVSALEMPVTIDSSKRDSWRSAFPEATLFLEGSASDLPQIVEAGAQAKLRCGGLRAEAVPDIDAVRRFIKGCVALDMSFKATAGLHEPLRHHDDSLGCTVHGFLNLLSATAAAHAGFDDGSIEEILRAEEAEALRLDQLDLGAARELFLAFGTCSIEEPLAGLAKLGLL